MKVMKAVSAAEGGVDLLLTSEWGRGYNSLLPATLYPAGMSSPEAVGSPAVKSLAAAVPARYHFAGKEGFFFQLPPYKNALAFTRFLGLGKVGDEKQKDLFACSLTPVASGEPAIPPANITPCPYDVAPKSTLHKAAESAEPPLKKQRAEVDMARFDGNYGFQDKRGGGGYNRWGLSETQVQEGRESDRTRKDPQGRKSHDVPPEGYTCHKCGKPDHFAVNCPSGRRSNDCWSV
jgi:hypothetical protein